LQAHVRLEPEHGSAVDRVTQWIVQAPERVLMPDEIAVSILKLCDGKTSVAAIAERLARDYRAPPDVIEADVLEMLRDLAEKGIVVHA
jgi:pyrroloquinoline quinone biosynthesis protein D